MRRLGSRTKRRDAANKLRWDDANLAKNNKSSTSSSVRDQQAAAIIQTIYERSNITKEKPLTAAEWNNILTYNSQGSVSYSKVKTGSDNTSRVETTWTGYTGITIFNYGTSGTNYKNYITYNGYATSYVAPKLKDTSKVMEQSANETFIRGVKANEIHSPDPLIPPSNDPFKNGLFSSITDPLNNIGLNIQRFLHYPEDFFTNGFTSYNPPISARYSAIDGELARQAGWTPQQAEFNYYGGRDIGLALSILIPAGSAYSSAVSTAAGLNSAAALVDDTVGGATGDAGNVLDWSNVNKNGQTSLEHVNKHGIPNYQRANHGVFSGNPQTMVERAWANKGNLQPITDGMGGSIYNIFYQNAGYQSGYQYFGQQMDYITIITQDGTSIVWSAFPSFGNYGANLVP